VDFSFCTMVNQLMIEATEPTILMSGKTSVMSERETRQLKYIHNKKSFWGYI